MSIEVGQLVKVRENSKQENWSPDPVMQDTIGQIGRVIYKSLKNPAYKVEFLFDNFYFNEEDLEVITLGCKESISAEFDWDWFRRSNEVAIHCSTEEQAIDFCKEMHEHGLKWYNGDSYLLSTEWEHHKENTCYWSEGAYEDTVYARSCRHKIIEWSDYMKKRG